MPLNQSLKGKDYGEVSFTVERDRVVQFADAIGDDNPIYRDAEAAKAAGYPEQVAPPTFLTTFRDESTNTAAFLEELGTDISRILHGEQEFEIHRPIKPGETFLCRGRVVDIYEKAGKSGPMAFVVRETTATDGEGEIVAVSRHITVVRL